MPGNPPPQQTTSQRYYAQHREACLRQDQAYRATHKEKIRAQRKAYKAARREERQARIRAAAPFPLVLLLVLLLRAQKLERKRALNRADYAAHRGKRLISKRAYNALHIEERRIKACAYARTNPIARQEASTRRRAAKAHAPINDLTHAQWREIQAAYDHRCVYCGKRRKGHLTQDHLTPLSQGGSHTARNVVPACSSCNSRKQAGPVLHPVQPLLLTLAASKPKRCRPARRADASP
jgi:5-methylcytosine-specific restriction endonuclease McrA